MGAPRIGITTYGRDEENEFTLPAEYVDAVRRAGGLPLLLAPGETLLDPWWSGIDALVLTGGGDLAPERYGGRPAETIYMVDSERDATELELARRLVASELPGLCICRGMQVLNVALGGTLVEHIPDEFGDAVAHRLPPREPVPHPVRVESGSRLAGVLGWTDARPMSWHHQALRELGRGLEVVARAPDGVIEAVELRSHPQVLAVQWHPELTAASEPEQQRLFDHLVELARRRA